MLPYVMLSFAWFEAENAQNHVWLPSEHSNPCLASVKKKERKLSWDSPKGMWAEFQVHIVPGLKFQNESVLPLGILTELFINV